MKYLSLILLCTFGISCGSIRTQIGEVLNSTKDLAVDLKKTSATLREDTLPAVEKTAKNTAEATDQLRASAIEIQRLVVNLEPKLEGISSKVISTLEELKALAHDARDLKAQLESEITAASDIRQKLSAHGSNLDMMMTIGMVLGAVLIILLVVIIHHKLTGHKRHTRQLEYMLKNGGKEQILEALQGDLAEKK